MSLFRELKAKKAAFGFETFLHSVSFMKISALVACACEGLKPERDFTINANSYGNDGKFVLYTDNPELAQKIRDLDRLPCVDYPMEAFLTPLNLFKHQYDARNALGIDSDGP